jgi:hypothetical protein
LKSADVVEIHEAQSQADRAFQSKTGPSAAIPIYVRSQDVEKAKDLIDDSAQDQ